MITQSELKKIIHYDSETGIITRIKKRGGRTKSGVKAGWIDKHGYTSYIRITINKTTYRAHRLIWLYMTGDFPKNQIDHKDGDGLNNKWSNIQDVTIEENYKNKRIYKNNKSGHTGVCWLRRSRRWLATICVNGKTTELGTFVDINDAIEVRSRAHIENGFSDRHGI